MVYCFFKGNTWCRRFQKDNCPDFTFHTVNQAEKLNIEFTDTNVWHEDKKSYIHLTNDNKLLPAAENIFVIEAEKFSLEEDESKARFPRFVRLMVSLDILFYMNKSIMSESI